MGAHPTGLHCHGVIRKGRALARYGNNSSTSFLFALSEFCDLPPSPVAAGHQGALVTMGPVSDFEAPLSSEVSWPYNSLTSWSLTVAWQGAGLESCLWLAGEKLAAAAHKGSALRPSLGELELLASTVGIFATSHTKKYLTLTVSSLIAPAAAAASKWMPLREITIARSLHSTTTLLTPATWSTDLPSRCQRHLATRVRRYRPTRAVTRSSCTAWPIRPRRVQTVAWRQQRRPCSTNTLDARCGEYTICTGGPVMSPGRALLL